MTSRFVVLTVVAVLAIACSLPALGAEHAVSCKTLPTAVQQKAQTMLDGGTIRGCVKDVSAGRTSYEVEMVKDGRGKDATFDATGNVLEVEQEVDMARLPEAVKAAFLKAAGQGGKIGKVESLTKANTLVAYEGVVTRNGKKKELAFRPDGTMTKAD